MSSSWSLVFFLSVSSNVCFVQPPGRKRTRKDRHAELVSASMARSRVQRCALFEDRPWTLKQVQGDDFQCRERSEEHTSELQSLMRISYAVFCMKKKKITDTYNQTRIATNLSLKPH